MADVRDSVRDARPTDFDGAGPGWAHPIRRFRRFMRTCSLKTSFVVYAVVATVLALVVSGTLASFLANQASDLRLGLASASGLYIYSEEENALVSSESLSWYATDGDPLFVEQYESGLLDGRIALDGSENDPDMIVYDGRLLSEEQLARGATDEAISLADIPAYDASQRKIAEEAGVVALPALPPNSEGDVPASSPIAYYVLHHAPDAAYDVFQVLSMLSFPVVFVAVFVITAHLFYRNNLKRPIAIMGDAAQRIADNDLDFELSSTGGNELGRLVDSFEKMRASLLAGNREMWRMIEARKRTNAAFAHDLRTPLTVLKGQIEMLASYVGQGSFSAEQIEDMARSSQRQVERIERYVESMRGLAKLEDYAVDTAEADGEAMVSRLLESARMVAEDCGKRAVLARSDLAPTVTVDEDALGIVADNLFANAARYAVSSVELSLFSRGEDVVMIVADDGPGFSADALACGLEPYFRDKNQEDAAEHFGLGLGVCALLVEKCGGTIELSNRRLGGACVTVRVPGARAS